MAQVNKISSFKSFTEIRKQESVSKLREENNLKRQESVGKIAAILDELGLTSFEGLEEDQKESIISKIFGDVSEEEIAEIEVEVEEVTESDEPKCTNKKGHLYKQIDKDGTVECVHCGLRNSLSESLVTEAKTVTKAAIEEIGDFRDSEGYSANQYYILADFIDGEITMKDLSKLVKSKEVQKELKGEDEIDMEHIEEFSESLVTERDIVRLGKLDDASMVHKILKDEMIKNKISRTRRGDGEVTVYTNDIPNLKKLMDDSGISYELYESVINEKAKFKVGDTTENSIGSEVEIIAIDNWRNISKQFKKEMGSDADSYGYEDTAKGDYYLAKIVKSEEGDEGDLGIFPVEYDHANYWGLGESLMNEALDIKYKRDAKKVLTQYNKIFAELGSLTADKISHLGAIKYIYAEALTDANFHRERTATEKIIKGRLGSVTVNPLTLGKQAIIVGAKKISQILDEYYSRISNAAGWSGIGVAEGTALYLESIGESKLAEKLLAGFNAVEESVKFQLTEEEISLKESKFNEVINYVINEGTRGQFGKIDKKGNITSVYTHYDSYPESVLPIIKATFKAGKNVDFVLKNGDNSGLDKDLKKINFYGGDVNLMKGTIKNINKYIKDANYEGGAEFVYLWDEGSKKWMMADIYGETGLVPAFESVVNESEANDILQDLLDERDGDMGELHGMEMEDALDTVEAYGHKGSKAKKIAKELVSMCNESEEISEGTTTSLDEFTTDTKSYSGALAYSFKNHKKNFNKNIKVSAALGDKFNFTNEKGGIVMQRSHGPEFDTVWLSADKKEAQKVADWLKSEGAEIVLFGPKTRSFTGSKQEFIDRYL